MPSPQPTPARRRTAAALVAFGWAMIALVSAGHTQPSPAPTDDALPWGPDTSTGQLVVFRDLPDVDLHLPAMHPRADAPGRELYTTAGARGWASSADAWGFGGAEVFAGATAGLWHAPDTWARARSEVIGLPASAYWTEAGFAATRAIESHHRLQARLGLGGLEPKTGAIDLGIDAAFDQHPGGGLGRAQALGAGPGAHRELTVSALVRPRFNSRSFEAPAAYLDTRHETFAFNLPLAYTFRWRDYDDGARTARMIAHGFSGTYGHRVFARSIGEGSIEYIKLGFERRSIYAAPGQCPPYSTWQDRECERRLLAFYGLPDDAELPASPSTRPGWTAAPIVLDRLSLRVFNLGFVSESDFGVLTVRGPAVGMEGQWDPTSNRDGGTPTRQGLGFAIDGGAMLRGRYVTVGANTSVLPDHTGDGARLLLVWRNEALFAAHGTRWGVSGRLIHQRVAQHEDATGVEPPAARHLVAAYAEGYLTAPETGWRAGVFGGLDDQPGWTDDLWDPWLGPTQRTTRAGVFVRWDLDLSPSDVPW